MCHRLFRSQLPSKQVQNSLVQAYLDLISSLQALGLGLSSRRDLLDPRRRVRSIRKAAGICDVVFALHNLCYLSGPVPL